MRPGQANRLAIRITNPGGRFDWRDSTTMTWGKAKLFASHGFGGLDRGLTLSVHPLAARIDDAWVLNTPEPGG
jgi:beta-galactosidase